MSSDDEDRGDPVDTIECQDCGDPLTPEAASCGQIYCFQCYCYHEGVR